MNPLEARTVCIDIDQTLCVSSGPDEYPDATCMTGAPEALRSLRRSGWVIVLLTGRHFNHWKTTVDWLKKNDLEYDQLVFGKPPARFYVDDRAIAFEGDWDHVLQRITASAG